MLYFLQRKEKKKEKRKKRKHDHRTKTEHNLNKNRTKSVYILYIIFFYFFGVVWYNENINVSCGKLPETCKKYLKSAWKSVKKRQAQ